MELSGQSFEATQVAESDLLDGFLGDQRLFL